VEPIERVERRLKLHDLRVLMSVVDQGSMAKAAERLATSQPAVSRAIADLEYSLGVRLLDRGPRGVVPTPYGRALVRRGLAVFDELKQGVNDIEFLADPTAGEVRIGAPVAFAAGVVTSAIDRFARRHPRVVCHLLVNDVPELYRALEERHVDLVISWIAFAQDHMQVQVLYEDPLSVVAATKNPWSRRRAVKLADLINEPWTLPPLDSTLGAAQAGVFRQAGLDLPRITVVALSALARIALVAKGRFLTITPESVLRFAGGDMAIKALPVKFQQSYRQLGIVTLKNRTLPPAARLFARDLAKPFATVKPKSAQRPQA